MKHIVRLVVLPWFAVVAARAQAPAADPGSAVWTPRAACALAAMREWAADHEARQAAGLPVRADGFRPLAFEY